MLRPPIASERVELCDDGLVRLTLERPWRDGTVAVDLDPLSLLVRLCATVPPPKLHLVRYAGVLGARTSGDRSWFRRVRLRRRRLTARMRTLATRSVRRIAAITGGGRRS